MILAVDVDYREDEAIIAGVCFENWKDENPISIIRSKVANIEDYEPGQFYKRELPCILKLIKKYDLKPDVIVVDGFVTLGKESKPGLGMHLYNSLECTIPVIGVAKRHFKDTASTAELLRGESKKPLYVTAVGVNEQDAKGYIHTMHGKYRIPTLLKLVDSECRKS